MLEFIIKKQNIFIYIQLFLFVEYLMTHMFIQFAACLLYTSDAADEL